MKILIALMLLSLPAIAAQGTTESSSTYSGVQGSMDTTSDIVRLRINGAQWATVKFQAIVAGTVTVTAQVTIDGTNYFPAPMARRLNTASANPTVQTIAATTLVAGDMWEVPLPGNALAFQLVAVTGTITTVTISGGVLYVPGVPVTAVLYDVTEGSIGAGVAAYVQDTSGWNSVTAMANSPTGQVWSIRQLDDTGAVLLGVAATFTAAAGGAATFTRYGSNTTTATVGSSAQALFANLTRRMNWSLPAAGTVSAGRMRVEAAR